MVPLLGLVRIKFVTALGIALLILLVYFVPSNLNNVDSAGELSGQLNIYLIFLFGAAQNCYWFEVPVTGNALLYCALLHSAALLRSAALCCALLRSAALCCALLRSAALCCALLRSTALCALCINA
jgi:hypothetical protein